LDGLSQKKKNDGIYFSPKNDIFIYFLIYIMADVGNFLVDNKIDPMVRSGYTLSI
jgi:hypothetical protein